MKIESIMKLLGSFHHALEVLYVINGVKKVTRLRIHEDERSKLNSIKDFAKNHNLSMQVSSFKYIMNEDSNETYYSSYSKPVNLNDRRKGFIYLYISKSEKLSWLAKICEEHQYSDYFGRILGYPECCIAFYNRHIQKCLKEKRDLLYSVLQETKIIFPYPFWNNFPASYFTVSLLSHYPCSFNCKESINIAKERLNLIKSVSSSWAEYTVKELKSAIILTNDKGIYKINDFLFKHNKIYLKKKDISCINKTYIWDIILQSTEININSKKNLTFIKENKVLKELKGISVFVFQQTYKPNLKWTMIRVG